MFVKPDIRDYLWVQGITYDPANDWQLNLVQRNSNKYSIQPLSLSDSGGLQALDIKHRAFARVTSGMSPVNWPSLDVGERLVAPGELIRQVLPGCPAGTQHAVYRMPGEPVVYIPAFLLIRALFMGMSQLTKRLFTPNGVDLLGHLADPTEERAIELVPDKRISGPNLTARIVRTLTWLLSARDARRSFGSVLGYAREGRLDIVLPSCGLTGWIWGIELDAGILAFQLNGVDLRFPIRAEEILVHTGNKIKRFAAYEPRVKSPWSRSSW